MKTKQAIRYVGTSDPISSKEKYHCEKYMKRHKADLVRAGSYLVDVAALLSLFHLDCGNCQKVHRETCCEGGQPYSVEEWQIPILEQDVPAIVGRLSDARVSSYAQRHGVWEDNRRGTIRLQHGNCFFYQEISAGRHGCAIHAYAEQTGKPVEPLKPFSCQLYPLDLIESEDGILLTAVTEETSSFSRWGTDYLENFYCASQERRKQAVHLDHSHFAMDGYRPAYQWNLPLLRYLLKEDAEKIEAVLQERYAASILSG